MRRAIHSVFLYHAIAAGMDMGIVNAGELPVYDHMPEELREAVEDVIQQPPAARRTRAPTPERLVELAPKYKGGKSEAKGPDLSAWRLRATVGARITHALVNDVTDFIEADTEEARAAPPSVRCTSSKAP